MINSMMMIRATCYSFVGEFLLLLFCVETTGFYNATPKNRINTPHYLKSEHNHFPQNHVVEVLPGDNYICSGMIIGKGKVVTIKSCAPLAILEKGQMRVGHGALTNDVGRTKKYKCTKICHFTHREVAILHCDIPDEFQKVDAHFWFPRGEDHKRIAHGEHVTMDMVIADGDCDGMNRPNSDFCYSNYNEKESYVACYGDEGGPLIDPSAHIAALINTFEFDCKLPENHHVPFIEGAISVIGLDLHHEGNQTVCAIA